MEKTNTKIEVRDLRNGDWYWIHKAVIQRYTPEVGAIGIAVYNFLASLANSSQSCFPSQKYIAEYLGYSRATINKTIKLLERNGLIRIEKRDRYHCIYSLLKVRCKGSFTSRSRCKPDETQMSTEGNSDVKQRNTNNNKLTRIINNIDIEDKNFLDSKFKTFNGFRPKNRQELLALDLAEALKDPEGLPLYLSYSICKDLLIYVLSFKKSSFIFEHSGTKYTQLFMSFHIKISRITFKTDFRRDKGDTV